MAAVLQVLRVGPLFVAAPVRGVASSPAWLGMTRGKGGSSGGSGKKGKGEDSGAQSAYNAHMQVWGP